MAQYNLKKKMFLLVFISLMIILSSCVKKQEETDVIEDVTEITDDVENRVILGDECFEEFLPFLEGKRVALFTNQSGIVGDLILNEEYETDDQTPFGTDKNGNELEYGEHILDVLIEKGVNVTCVFSPEHGFRGEEDAGASIDDDIDEKTGVALLSLYSDDSNYPSAEDMDRFDILIVDMQDVGLRYYTYYISLYYLMDACAEYDKTMIILDRPNPNGFYVDGPIIEKEYYSDVGVLPIPVVYGMTWGELSRMINGEGWLKNGKDSLDLIVITCKNYDHQKLYNLIKRPSPNLKDMRSVYLYASTCFFEYSYVSVGRGTDHPFEIYGSPYFESCEEFDYTFTPVSMSGARYPQYEDELCYGKDLRDGSLVEILSNHIDLSYIIDAYNRFNELYPELSFFGEADYSGKYWIDYLSGSSALRQMITDGYSEKEIKASWQDDLEAFLELRKPYLLYKEYTSGNILLRG